MAKEDKKISFPVIPSGHWWALRKKFKQSIPGVVTDNYIASVLNMKLSSARANVLPALKATKIIDGDGKSLERAKRWRDDAQYAKVCEEIRLDIYPEELLSGIPDPSKDKQAAETWFANHTGGKDAAVRKITQFYTLLSEADPSKATAASDASPKAKKPKGKPTPNAQKPAVLSALPQLGKNNDSNDKEKTLPTGPAVHINLQIHISADASSDQIEQMFASMAKHIYTAGVTK